MTLSIRRDFPKKEKAQDLGSHYNPSFHEGSNSEQIFKILTHIDLCKIVFFILKNLYPTRCQSAFLVESARPVYINE